MTRTNYLTNPKKIARITGLFYFLIILGGLFAGMIARGSIVDLTDPMQTLNKLIENESLFRLGFLGDLIMAISDVIVSILFYVLLKKTDKLVALLAMGFRMIQAALIGANLLNLFKPVLMIKGATGLDAEARSALANDVMGAMEVFEYGYLLSGVFFAINCALMGYLLFKSEYFPKALGIMIGLASIGYMFNCMAHFVVPSMIELSQTLMFFTAVISELALCLYLLIKGVK